MRLLSTIELELIVGGYGETGGDSFDESVYESRATANEDGSYSVDVTSAEYDADAAAAQADEWEITGEWDLPGGIHVIIRPSKSSNSS
jgi:hypothetical protein